MGWSGALFEELAKARNTPVFVVESETMPGFNPLVPGMKLSSRDIGDGYIPAILPGGVRIQGGEVHPGEWSYTHGSATIDFATYTDQRWVAPRGAMMKVKVGYPGDRPEDMSVIFLGHLQDVRRSWQPGAWSMTIREALSGLISRWDSTADMTPLFADIELISSITVSFGVADTTMTVANNAFWQRESTGDYWIRVAPISGSDPFLIRATGAPAATSFTGCSTALWGGTRSIAGIGSIITYVAGVEAHPVDYLRKILLSTGNGTNGAFDDLPAEWGLALERQYVDEADISQTRARMALSFTTTSALNFVVEERQEDALGWMLDWMKDFGLFFSMRQGAITIRCPAWQDTIDPPSQVIISDRDIVTLRSGSTWDPKFPAEFEYIKATDPYTSSNETDYREVLGTRPALERRETLMEHVTAVDSNDRDTWREWNTQTVGRGWQRIPETIEVVVGGLQFAWAAVGDWLRLDTSYHLGRNQSLSGPFRGAPLFITRVDINWLAGQVTIRAINMPVLPL